VIDALVVGLGNPGKEYTRTRHNVGAEAVALLVERAGEKFKAGRNKALVADARISGKRVILAFPTTYMNESGQAVGSLMRRHKITDPQQLIVVHDELDLPPGTIKVKWSGGLAGNNGLRSIKSHVKTEEFARVRIGVGKPPGRMDGADHVLRRPGRTERGALDVAIEDAADAVELIVADGIETAMQRYNQRG